MILPSEVAADRVIANIPNSSEAGDIGVSRVMCLSVRLELFADARTLHSLDDRVLHCLVERFHCLNDRVIGEELLACYSEYQTSAR